MKNTRVVKEKEKIVEEKMFVTFSLAGDKFGVDVSKIQEIIGVPETAHVPNTMAYMKGVTNLRGRVIPLIDLRIKFSLPEKEYDKMTVVLIAEVSDICVGLIVDSVSDVVSLPVTDIQDTPHFSDSINADCIEGTCKMEKEILIIIDVDQIFDEEELSSINK